MTLCSCCFAPVQARVISTWAGRFESPFGLCRQCWRGVPKGLRLQLGRALKGYAKLPTTERAIATYELWLLCIGERLVRAA